MTPRIAIVGSGVSGLAALWALHESKHEVHLFEAQDYIGGHVQTVEWKNKDTGEVSMVDIAFALFNEVTYPNFVSFLSHMKISTRPMRVTFGITRNDGEFEWSTKSILGVFAQLRNIFSLTMWRMLFDILRFNTFAADILVPSYPFKEDSIGSYLRRNNYSEAFIENYLIPLTSTIWVIDPAALFASQPAMMIIRYLWNHHLLCTFESTLQWLVIDGGASKYVDAILKDVPSERINVSTKVLRVRNNKDGSVTLMLENERKETFDKVIIATHAPQALNLIEEDCTTEEKDIMKNFKTTHSSVVLHSDLSFMPRNRRAWSAWNYLDNNSPLDNSTKRVSLTFNLSHDLSQEDTDTDDHILTTLNPSRAPDSQTVQGKFNYSHPLYDNNTLPSQERLEHIQGSRNIWFAGAWTNYGFHEDGFTSGLKAAIGIAPEIRLPFTMKDWKDSRGATVESLNWTTRILRLFLAIVQMLIVCATSKSQRIYGKFTKKGV